MLTDDQIDTLIHKAMPYPSAEGQPVAKLDWYRALVRASEAEVLKDAPAWHDAPTCVGNWLCANRRFRKRKDEQYFVEEAEVGWSDGARYFGPIPADTGSKT